jgi:hypothetical protein
MAKGRRSRRLRMGVIAMTSVSSPSIIRWVARIWSLASIAFVLAFLIGEGLSDGSRGPNVAEAVGLALFPLGVGVGLVIAWRWEILGGALAIGCLIAFYLWLLIIDGKLPRGPYFLLVAAPGILFMIHRFLSRGH